MADHNGNKGLLLSNRTYNILQQIALLGLPGLGTFYFTMAGLFKWGYGNEIVGACAATGVFIGVILKMSQAAWNNTDNPDGKYDGDILLGITDDDRPNTLMTALNKHPEQFAGQENVLLKVKKVPVAANLEPSEGEIPPVV